MIGSKNRSGYSLVDLVVSVAILTVIAGAASLSVQRSAPRQRLLNAVREIHSRMNAARYRAIFKGSRVRIRFEPTGCTLEDFDPIRGEWIPRPLVVFEGVTITANNTPTFHPIGTVSNLASIYVSNRAGRYRISIAISGRIRSAPVI